MRQSSLPDRPRPPVPPDAAISPRISALSARIEVGDSAALADFWAQVSQEGAPLLEPAEDYADQLIVTFVWRGHDPETRAVLLVAGTLTDHRSQENNLAPHLMQRLGKSDLWYKSFRLHSDFRTAYQIFAYDSSHPESEPAPGANRETWMQILTSASTDPLNPQLGLSPYFDIPVSIVSLPAALPQPWLTPRHDIALGSLQSHTLESAHIVGSREISVYLPHGYAPEAGPYPLLLLFDGEVWMKTGEMVATLDQLIAAGRIPPMIALLVHNPDYLVRNNDLPCHPPFVEFLTKELLPWAAERWSITADPARTIVAGQSYGGLAASFAAHTVPERFGNVLSQSGSFWWPTWDSESDTGWLTEQLSDAPLRPVRWYLEAGLYEGRLLETNRRMRDLLNTKGYPLIYHEFNGGHDYACWRGGIADGLLALAEDW